MQSLTFLEVDVEKLLENDEVWAEIIDTRKDAIQIETLQSNVGTSNITTVFVYGTQVKDFHTVDYDGISMLNVSATQALYRQGLTLEKQNEVLQQRAIELQQQLEKIERLESLLSELEER